MPTNSFRWPNGGRPRLGFGSSRPVTTTSAVAGTEALLDAVLDVVGARLLVGDVGPDGSVRVDVRSAGDLIGAGDESSVVALISRTLAQERSEGEVRLVGGDGRSRWLRLRCRAVPSADHPGHQRLVAVFDDVTEQVENRLDARHDERLRLARELHDGMGQTLTSAALFARSLEGGAGDASRSTVTALRGLVEAALTETKVIMWRLRPTEVEQLGFEAALLALAETFRRCHGVRVDVHLSAVDGLSPAVEAAAYRVAQEAMTNAVKHAAPTVLSVLACRRGATVAFVVEDDGTGFDPFALGNRGAGILGMRERAVALGGRLDVEARRGHGTTVRLVVPCEPGIPQ